MSLMQRAHGWNKSQAAALAPERAAGSAHLVDGGADLHGNGSDLRFRHRAATRWLRERLAVRRQLCRGCVEWRSCPARNLWAWSLPESQPPGHMARRMAAIAPTHRALHPASESVLHGLRSTSPVRSHLDA